MKTLLVNVRRTLATSLFALICIWIGSNAAAQILLETNVTATANEYQCVERGPNSKIWQQTVLETNQSGDVTTNFVSYTELATGLCYLQNGQYVDSVEQIDAVADGAQATQGSYQVHWAANANTAGGAVNLTTTDGKTLLSTVYGLLYYDSASGSNVLLTQLQDCTATITGSNLNTLLYANAFSNLTADVRYTYHKAGLSQDIILRQQPPPPTEYGFDPTTTQMEVLTEFFNPPAPVETTVTNNDSEDILQLSFGEMQMGVGFAFLFQNDDSTEGGVPVTKQWTNFDGRTFLIEGVPYSSISNLLSSLHSSVFKPDKSKVRRTVSLERPKIRNVSAAKSTQSVKVAKTMSNGTGLVLDYNLTGSTNSLTLQGDTTYLVTGDFVVSGTVIIEGGTVVKYVAGGAPSHSPGKLEASEFICETGPYRPGVFTDINDNSVGARLNLTGAPVSGNNADYLYYTGSGTSPLTFNNLRFSYAQNAIVLNSTIYTTTSQGVLISDCQFVNCGTGVQGTGENGGSGGEVLPFNVLNVLFSMCGNALALSWTGSNPGHIYINPVNVTADSLDNFLSTSGDHFICSATNSIFTAVSDLGGISPFTHCAVYSTSNGIYQTAGAGAYYLTNSSTNRNSGTTNIGTNLLADLQAKTTHPPVILPVGWLTNGYTFSPQAQRDTNGSFVDLGYHYDPLDYALSVELSNVTATVNPGTALAMMGTNYGIQIFTNSTFKSAGTATSPNFIVRYNTVQEQSNFKWISTNWEASFLTPGASDLTSSASFFFTEWSVLAGDGHLTTAGDDATPVDFQDCQFLAGTINASGQTLLTTNCLFQRVNLTLNSDVSGDVLSNRFYNNLFLAGALLFEHKSFDTGTWAFRDNLFDQTSITVSNFSSADIFSNNAYVTNFNKLATNSSNVILTNSPAYQSGALGDYYYPTNLTNLIYRGSRSAPSAGLYHYTVTTNNVIEGTNTVSIGFHYVATDANGLPLDTAGDGIPDYLADANGDGIYDAGDLTNWALAILSQPVNQIACDGGNSTFSMTAGGVAPLIYQWQFNGSNISVATNSSLTLFNLISTQAGNYTVVVTNVFGTITSSVATLTVVGVASLAPTNNTNCILLSSNATLQTWTIPVSTNPAVSNLAVVAVSAPNLPLGSLPGCWSLNGVFTNSTNVCITNPAVYTIVCSAGISSITNIIWVTTPSNMFVAVAYDSSAVAYSANGINWTNSTMPSTNDWYRVAYGNGQFVAVAQDSTTAAYSGDGIHWSTSTMPSATWYGVAYGDGKFVAVAPYSNIVAYSSDGITWSNSTMPSLLDWDAVAYGNGKFVALAYGSTEAYSTDGIHWTNSSMPDFGIWYSIAYGDGEFMALAADSSTAAYSSDGISWSISTMPSAPDWFNVDYGNGEFVAIASSSSTSAYCTNGVTWTGSTTPAALGWDGMAYGNGEFVAVVGGSNTMAYSSNGVTWSTSTMPTIDNWQSVTYGNGPSTPSIVTQPLSLAVSNSSAATFSVTADGSPPLSYQWQFNGVSIMGANNSSYTISNAQISAAGTYSVIVANVAGNITSAGATLTILPYITTQPASQILVAGSNASFSVIASGSSLSYQWQWNGTNVSGATASSLTITNVKTTNAGSYSVTVSNIAASLTSATAGLTVVTVASLAPTNSTNCTLVSSNIASLQTWSIPVSTNTAVSNLEIIAVSAPNLSLTNLPAGWLLDGVFTNITYVSITNIGVYTVICAAGTACVTNIIWVTGPGGEVEQGCTTNGPSLLGYWSFNNSWTGNNGQQPTAEYNLLNPASQWGQALQVDTNVSANLSYNYMESNGTANIYCIDGAVSFWFKPDWNGGAGPGNTGELLEMGDGTANSLWSLSVDSTGSTLSFQSSSNGFATSYFSQPITNWSSNNWYQLVLEYSTSATSLSINRALAQTGPGMTNYPTIADRTTYGFSIGSSLGGTNQIRGLIDELYTFNCSLLGNDGYGTPNAWYATNGLNPQIPDIGSTDYVGIGLLNYQDYLYGSSPTASETFTLWISEPTLTCGIP